MLTKSNRFEYQLVVSKRLSPDPLMVDPAKLDNYDRYAYAYNNPIRYLEPSGYAQVGSYHHRPNTLSSYDYTKTRAYYIAFLEAVHAAEAENYAYVRDWFHSDGTSGGHAGPMYSTADLISVETLTLVMNASNVLANMNNPVAFAQAMTDWTGNAPGELDDQGDPKKEKKEKNEQSKVGTWDPVTNLRIDDLDSRLQGPATDFINAAAAQGVKLRITQGHRTMAEQDDLYAQGRTKPGKIVTNAKGGESYHNYGLAFDVVIMKNGQPVWDVLPCNIGALGVTYGFEWGGDWKTFKDYPHFQMTFGQSILQLQKK